MPTLIRARAIRLGDAWGYGLLGEGEHPSMGAQDEETFSERLLDGRGRELSFVRWDDHEKERVHYSRRNEYDPEGRKVGELEFFGEAESEVVHRTSRGEAGETEAVEYDGVLESTYEREFHPNGKLKLERLVDADGNDVEVGEWDEEGRLLLNETQEKGVYLEYSGGAIVKRTEVIEGVETVETIEVEGGRPVRSVLVADGEEVSRRTWTYEGLRTRSELKDGDELLGLDVEELDEAGRVVYREVIEEREGGVHVRSVWRNRYWPGGLLMENRLERTILVPGAPPKPYRNGFRQATWDDAGRMKELLLCDWREDDFEENCYYRFEYLERE